MTGKFTRREMLRLGAGTLLAYGLWPGRLSAADAPAAGDFTFIAVNDFHYKDRECAPWFENVLRQMKESAPDAELCLLGGDQADDGSAEQLTSVRDIFAKFGAPVHAVVGNHDHLLDHTRAAYERIFPGQINYTFEHRGWQVLALDTTQGRTAYNTAIPAYTLSWLDENLPKLDRKKPTIILTHFPLGKDVVARPRNADDLLNRFLDFNLQAALNGHYHGFTERKARHAILTTDRCCSRVRPNHDGTKEKGWFVCRASAGQVSRRFVTFTP